MFHDTAANNRGTTYFITQRSITITKALCISLWNGQPCGNIVGSEIAAATKIRKGNFLPTKNKNAANDIFVSLQMPSCTGAWFLLSSTLLEPHREHGPASSFGESLLDW